MKAFLNSRIVLFLSLFFFPTLTFAAPTFSDFIVQSDNSNNSFAKEGDLLTFKLSLMGAEDSNGGTITFNIGSAIGLTAPIPVSGITSTKHLATYSVLAGQDGTVEITNITFANSVPENIINLPVFPHTPISNVTVDTKNPILTNVHIESNNTDTTKAKTNDNIIVTFTASEVIENVAATIFGKNTTVTNLGSNNWKAELMTSGNEPEGIPPFSIDFTDKAGNLGAPVINTTDSSSVTFDKTNPTLTNVHIKSNNTDTTKAKTNDNIIVTFTASEVLESVAATIFGENATVTNLGSNNWKAELMTSGNEPEGIPPFSIDFTDKAGNLGAPVINTTDSSSVTFDKTNPIINNVLITASNPYLTDAPTFYAKNSETITLTFTSNEKIKTPTGTILGKNASITNPSADQKNWIATITTANTDHEGTIPFAINVFDLTGNGDGITNPLVTITATTNGSSVIFDRTAPTIPTTVLDNLGAVTTNFKHRSNARYTWSGHQDLDETDSFAGSGVSQFLVRLNNVSAGYNETATQTMPATSHDFYAQKILPPNDNDYNLFIEVVDKAGNHSLETQLYSQKYTIGLLGKVVDKNGNAIPNATVQVAATYGDTCDTGTDLCSDTTDTNGNYAIVLQKDRNYIASYFERKHYLAKTTTSISQEDVTQNITLESITARKQYQSSSQIIQLLAQKEENNQTISSKIFINSLSGQIETEPTTDGFLIRSFSRITSVTSSNSNVIIIDNGDNTFTVKNAGSVVYESTKTDFGVATTIGDESFSTGSSFESGDSRVGVIATPSSGKAHLAQSGRTKDELLSHGKFWTEAESNAFTEAFNKGVQPKTNFYINRNGFKVFAGYTSGRLGVDNYEKRHQNQVFYRGKKVRKTRTQNALSKEKPLISLAEKIKEMKETYQKQYKKSVNKRGKSQAGYIRLRNEDTHKSVENKRQNDQKKVNKFAKKRTENNNLSRIKGKNNDVIKLKIKGKSVAMSKIFTTQEPEKLIIKTSTKPIGTFFSEEISW